MRLQKVDEHLKEKLKDPYFKELYELEEQKLKIVKRLDVCVFTKSVFGLQYRHTIAHGFLLFFKNRKFNLNIGQKLSVISYFHVQQKKG